MYRLKYLWAALLLASLLSACGGQSTGESAARSEVTSTTAVTPAPREDGTAQSLPESDLSRPAQFTPVSAEFARLMRSPDSALFADIELPANDELGRLPSVVGTDTLLGKDSFKFGKASNQGNAKRLISSDGTAWVMYRFPGYNFHKDPGTLTVTTAAQSFGGAEQGYLVAMANYGTGRWQVLGSSTASTPFAKSLLVGDDYRSPGSNIYVAVLLPKGQQLDVSSVALNYNQLDWIVTTVDPLAGWTPGLAFLPNGNPFIAYGDVIAGKPLVAILDRADDPGKAANWLVGEMNSLNEGVGLGQDVCLGPSGQPRVSLAYTGINNPKYWTIMGFTAYYDKGSSNEAGFWNYEFGKPKEGDTGILQISGGTSTDYNSAAGKYGYAVHFETNGAARYRQFTLNELVPQDTINTAGGLTGSGYFFPRLRFAPEDPLLYFANGGGFLTQEDANTLTDIYEDGQSAGVCSLSVNPQAGASKELWGFVYKHFETSDNTSAETLRYVPLLQNLNLSAKGIQPVDAMEAGAANLLGDFTQVEFRPDGNPSIAYTRDDGTKISIWYASWDGDTWQKEQVGGAFTKYTSDLRVWLDLAIDSDGIAGISWNNPTADDASSLMFAIRGS